MHATVPHTYNYNWFSILIFIVYIEINAERGGASSSS